MYSLNLISAYFKLDNLVITNLAFLNKTMSSNNNKEFPLTVIPVLSLSDTRLRYIHGELTTISSFQQLSS